MIKFENTDRMYGLYRCKLNAYGEPTNVFQEATEHDLENAGYCSFKSKEFIVSLWSKRWSELWDWLVDSHSSMPADSDHKTILEHVMNRVNSLRRP
jgi:hypothetical protein